MGTHNISSVTSPEYLHLGLDHENEKSGGFIAALSLTAIVTMCVVKAYSVRVLGLRPKSHLSHMRRQKSRSRNWLVVKESPPGEVFQIGSLESMEDVALSQ